MGAEARRVLIAVAVTTFRLASDDFGKSEGFDGIGVIQSALEWQLSSDPYKFMNALHDELDAVPR